MKKTIIKCINCGFKYYDGDIHKCEPVRVVSVVEEKTKDVSTQAGKRVSTKTKKESFKIWKDN